jgi:hypothetical protein
MDIFHYIKSGKSNTNCDRHVSEASVHGHVSARHAKLVKRLLRSSVRDEGRKKSLEKRGTGDRNSPAARQKGIAMVLP